ncbi:MAG: hypothetical protein H6925_04755 [Holosporaceae bacterium]|nr:MAG: hypothetical protein H6925_04755 [Holosporaceae bacterium]
MCAFGNDQTLKALEFETPAAEITYMFGDTILCTLKPNMPSTRRFVGIALKRSKSQKRVDPTASAMDDKPDAAATGNVTVRRRGSIFGGRSGGKGKKVIKVANLKTLPQKKKNLLKKSTLFFHLKKASHVGLFIPIYTACLFYSTLISCFQQRAFLDDEHKI